MEQAKNDYLDHYGKHDISPVRQDISDLQRHIARRQALYRSLGLLPSAFRGSRVLEVGPGSGYNALVVAGWQPESFALVESNPRGRKDMQELFSEHGLMGEAVEIVASRIEDYQAEEPFDIVLCEGMIPGLLNKEEILDALSVQVRSGGVLVITCADEVSIFFEFIRYFVAQRLTAHLPEFDDKIVLMVEAFESHLQTIKGMSRFVEDWCADSLMGEALLNHDFSIRDALDYLADDYTYFGASPDLFENYAWYKQIPLELRSYNEHYLDQFDRKCHNLLDYLATPDQRLPEQNRELYDLCDRARRAIQQDIYGDGTPAEAELIRLCGGIAENLGACPAAAALQEIGELLVRQDYQAEAIAHAYPHFRRAFGRGQQYLSLARRED